jgi:hypothetical protein
MSTADRALFARALVALRPYLGDIVVAGGWAHRLHALHPLAQNPRHEPLMTLDADMAVDDRLQARGARISALLAEDFEARFSRDEPRPADRGPAVCRYVPKGEPTEFYVEFIAPLRGSAIKHGVSNATVDVAGASAQTLRYVDLLLEEPWTVQVAESGDYPVGPETIIVRVPNPTAYIVQKILVLPRRGPDQAKDLLYVHDTLVMFGAAVDDLGELWRRISAKSPGKTVKRFHDLCATHCRAVTDVTREATAIARASGRSPVPTPDEIAAVLRAGTLTVFAN